MSKTIFFTIFLTTLSFLLAPSVQAGAEHNVSGWAWSENIGWISFNNTSGGGTTNYGVNINTSNGNFSGYAWSENIGWIDFAPAGPYPTEPNYSAKLDLTTNKVSGWARALAYGDGWDGWIKMSGTAQDGSNYGVSRSGCELTGYAWGSDVVGWIKFKGIAQNGSPYGVVTTFCENQPLSAINLSVDAHNPADYCGVTGYPPVRVRWQFQAQDSGDYQSAYQIQVFRQDDGSLAVDTGTTTDNCTGNCASYVFQQAGKRLSWNTPYTWQIKVWDNNDTPSSWIPGPSFTTVEHAYPTIDFSWTPQKPNVGEVVQFTDQSIVYGGATSIAWDWTFQDGNPSNSSNQNATTTFTSGGPKTVTLKVTDSDGFSCQSSKTVNATLPLPEWREVPPIIWLKKILANIGSFFSLFKVEL